MHIPGAIEVINKNHLVPSWCTAETLHAKFSKIIICPYVFITVNSQWSRYNLDKLCGRIYFKQSRVNT